jgi:2-phospho-L-lactate guanylyltransferase
MLEESRCAPLPDGDEVVSISLAVDALVPVKGTPDGKARLARLLSPAQRQSLVRAMLHDVVETLRASPGLRRVAVTSPDAGVLALAERLGAVPLLEPPDARGLNAALTAAVVRLEQAGAEAVLIVQGDVPEIGTDDVAAMLDGVAARPRLVRGAPSDDGGTSALLLRPPHVIAPAFGPDSFARHRAAAEAAGLAFEQCDRGALAVDIDRPRDLERLLSSSRAPRTREALAQDTFLAHPGVGERYAAGES